MSYRRTHELLTSVCLMIVSGTPLVVSLTAIVRARREDIPAVVRALSSRPTEDETPKP